MSAASIKEKAMFAASVLVVVAAVTFAQRKWGTLPVVGDFLPK